MSSFFKRVIISLAVPVVFILGFPLTAYLFKDTGRIVWLQGEPQHQIAVAVGVILITSGLALMASTIPFFLRQKQGTIMPWEPSEELIIEGIYRYVRNPMHIGVFSIMIGEGLLLNSIFILCFGTFAVISHFFYIPFSEERGLEDRFGEDYRIYKQNVPRWLPRLTAWNPDEE